VECQDYYLLVENRCESDCGAISDARSILSYGGTRMGISTMEIYYGISVTALYTWITTTTITTITKNIGIQNISAASSGTSEQGNAGISIFGAAGSQVESSLNVKAVDNKVGGGQTSNGAIVMSSNLTSSAGVS